MTNKKITDFASGPALTGNEFFPIAIGDKNYKYDLNFISTWFSGKPTAYNFGALADDPAVSPFDGGPIPLGAQYYNTTLNAIRAYGDGGWFTPNLDAAIFALATGAQLVGTPEGTVQDALDARATTATVAPLLGIGTTPTAQGQTEGGTPGVDNNPLIGGYGTPDPNASSKTRTAWDAISSPPTVGTNSLGMTGNTIDPTVNSAPIIGGRVSYYSKVGYKAGATTASVSLTYGGDNWNGHLAGMCFAMHSDLMGDVATNRGDHGSAWGGSFKQLSGNYPTSVGGTMHQGHGISIGIFAGSNIKVGAVSDATLVRRSTTLGGFQLNLQAGYESSIIGGQNNVHTSGDRSVTVGGESGTMAASNSIILGGISGNIAATHSATLAGLRNKTEAIASLAFGRDAVAKIENGLTQCGGTFTGGTAGDNQVHYFVARREFTGGGSSLSINGSTGVDIFTPAANTMCALEMTIHGCRVDTPGEGCMYKLYALFSNVGGTLVIKSQSVTVIHEDDAAYNVVAAVNGSGARVGVNVFAPTSGHTTRWFGHGTISTMKVTN